MNLYISTDVETDGPIPGINSMLSLGSAWFDDSGVLRERFSANLQTLPGAVADPNTMDWWAGQPEAWAACRQDQEPPEAAMHVLCDRDQRSIRSCDVGCPNRLDDVAPDQEASAITERGQARAGNIIWVDVGPRTHETRMLVNELCQARLVVDERGACAVPPDIFGVGVTMHEPATVQRIEPAGDREDVVARRVTKSSATLGQATHELDEMIKVLPEAHRIGAACRQAFNEANAIWPIKIEQGLLWKPSHDPIVFV